MIILLFKCLLVFEMLVLLITLCGDGGGGRGGIDENNDNIRIRDRRKIENDFMKKLGS